VMVDSEAVYREPSQAEKDQLAAVEAYLFLANGDPTSKYQKYIDLRDKYDDAFAACEEDRGNAPDCKAPLRNKKNQARDRWEVDGRKNEVEGNLQRYHQLTQTAAAWFRQLRERFQKAEEQADGIPFHRVLTYPSYPKWSDGQGWTKYALTDTELEQQRESTRVSYGGGGGASFGLFSIGGSSYTNEGKTYAKSKTNGITIDVEIKRVTLFRPWLNRVVFESDRWRFAPGGASGGLKLSDGRTNPPGGLMPLYPTGVLIARKLRIHGLDATDIENHFEKQVSHSGSVGWGPFRVSGHYSESTSKDYKFARRVGNSLEFDDPQVIGIYAEVLRESPKPTTDPALQFLSNPPQP